MWLTPLLADAMRRRRRPPSLIDCERCGYDLINPIAWLEYDEDRWWVRVRCGNCQTVREVVIDNEQARQFHVDLDRGKSEIARSLSRVTQEGSGSRTSS